MNVRDRATAERHTARLRRHSDGVVCESKSGPAISQSVPCLWNPSKPWSRGRCGELDTSAKAGGSWQSLAGEKGEQASYLNHLAPDEGITQHNIPGYLGPLGSPAAKFRGMPVSDKRENKKDNARKRVLSKPAQRALTLVRSGSDMVRVGGARCGACRCCGLAVGCCVLSGLVKQGGCWLEGRATGQRSRPAIAIDKERG
ncbi:hypothetical protein B0T25DRAFT_526150 [Lasiosphaeria hispida]|uniref:Uncharacterized protein n=1 Tax=Lasiosphaeria hispida TaxID=260671 RepID=A0AAJ0HUB5_9PEZI|nr:hypothetical protein B0T25DRAFT_526150 [Lasiosphaeria hispida]